MKSAYTTTMKNKLTQKTLTQSIKNLFETTECQNA